MKWTKHDHYAVSDAGYHICWSPHGDGWRYLCWAPRVNGEPQLIGAADDKRTAARMCEEYSNAGSD